MEKIEISNECKEIWKKALAQLEVKLDNPTHFKTWFLNTNLIEIDQKKAVLAVSHHYGADWLKRKHQDDIEDTLTYIFHGKSNVSPKIKVAYKISSELTKESVLRPSKKSTSSSSVEPSLLEVTGGQSNQLQDAITRNQLNPKWSFESFVTGDSNKMAHAAAMAAADNPGKVYNPLFLYGNTGLGKTHLAHSVGRRMLEKNPDKKIIYIPAEGFMNEMVQAIRTGKNVQFREKYRKNADLLVIDDIQFISNWEKTQTEFFNTFNVLQAAYKQIIIISDRPPEELENLTARLRSRFQGGIVVEVNRPDYEHRLAILGKKLMSMGARVDDRYLEFIAKNITDNIRELEGALQKIVLLQNLKPGYELSMEEIAQHLGKDAISKRKKITVPQVLKTVAKEFDLKTQELKGRKRTADVALARQICMYILREELNYKLEEIAKQLNRKDHTTVMHGIDKVTSKRMSDESFRGQLLGIVEKISGYD